MIVWNDRLRDDLSLADALERDARQMGEGLVAAKRELWALCAPEWNLADCKNFAVVQQIDAALEKARSKSSPALNEGAEG